MTEEPTHEEPVVVSTTEAFLRAVEAKVKDPIHTRLLAAARGSDPVFSLESEFQAIVSEIIHAD
jgi:hypothetical protein